MANHAALITLDKKRWDWDADAWKANVVRKVINDDCIVDGAECCRRCKAMYPTTKAWQKFVNYKQCECYIYSPTFSPLYNMTKDHGSYSIGTCTDWFFGMCCFFKTHEIINWSLVGLKTLCSVTAVDPNKSLAPMKSRVAEVARGHGGPRSSLDSDENFKPEHTLFCRELRFVAIYALFLEIFGHKKCLFG